ncbi:MAG: hypothetical protein OCD00_07045 [Colwellia sp.]
MKKSHIKKSHMIKKISLALLTTLMLASCTSLPEKETSATKSYLHQDKSAEQENTKIGTQTGSQTDSKNQSNNAASPRNNGISYISPLSNPVSSSTVKVDLTQQFSESEFVQISADDFALKDYLHYVMGEVLGVSYILGEQIKSDLQSVTLNLQQNISQRKLFNVSEQLLAERGYIIRFEEGIYYIHKQEGSGAQSNIVYGYGKKIEDVPKTNATIIQLVPFTFGMQTSLAGTLRQITSIKATADFQRSTIILQGKRKEVIRALEFINLMDQPVFKNRHIGVYEATYVSTTELVEKLSNLLKQEGISVSGEGQNDLAVSLVPLDRIATVVIFANSKKLIDRTGFWAKKIDQAPSGNQLQYFLYQPQYARATDLGQSLTMLINGGTGTGNANTSIGTSTSAASQNKQKGASTQNRSSISASNEDMSLVVDERANALILNATGDKYRQLLPLIKRLDVMPKQVILEMMIAEVKLTDVFKQGVEFALTNLGDAALTGGFDFQSGATGLTYLLTGAQGHISYNLLQTNTNVNVLSRPSLLVRDGVSATINVGDDIPTVGEIVSDPINGPRTSIVYRKTGVELRVTPTINARGIIIMEIDQKISNQTPGDDSVAGSPIIFERSISTEVVAESGQTIILGGLISESRTINDRGVPFFSSIPLIGSLFDSTSDNKDKTELVVLVTPKIIESVDEWAEIKAKFSSNLTKLKLEQ